MSQNTQNPQNPYTSYSRIFSAWDRGASMNDIYHMIVAWIGECAPAKAVPDVAKFTEDFMRRAVDGDETNDLVEDFIYGDRYAGIRDAFNISK